MQKMKQFLGEANLLYKLCKDGKKEKQESAKQESIKNKDHILNGKTIVMTKIRDKTIISALEEFGGKLENNITKKTFTLITKSLDDVSSKTKKAQELGIPIMTPEEFIKKYL